VSSILFRLFGPYAESKAAVENLPEYLTDVVRLLFGVGVNFQFNSGFEAVDDPSESTAWISASFVLSKCRPDDVDCILLSGRNSSTSDASTSLSTGAEGLSGQKSSESSLESTLETEIWWSTSESYDTNMYLCLGHWERRAVPACHVYKDHHFNLGLFMYEEDSNSITVYLYA
jgi:hypothetical protein